MSPGTHVVAGSRFARSISWIAYSGAVLRAAWREISSPLPSGLARHLVSSGKATRARLSAHHPAPDACQARLARPCLASAVPQSEDQGDKIHGGYAYLTSPRVYSRLLARNIAVPLYPRLLLPLIQPRVVPCVVPRHEEFLQTFVLHCNLSQYGRRSLSGGWLARPDGANPRHT
jgi:hypothetical protein